MLAYITSIEAYRDRLVTEGAKEGSRRECLEKWDDALKSANQALTLFRDAESKRHESDVAGANQFVLEGQTALNRRYDFSFSGDTHSDQLLG